MPAFIRYHFPETVDRTAVEEDLSLATFCAECLYGGPRVRHELRYAISADGHRCAVSVGGAAGDAAVRVFTGLCTARFGETGFAVEDISVATEVSP